MKAKDDKGGLVYVLIDMTNGMCYVGQTTKTLDERFKERAKCKITLIGQMIRENGVENFNRHVLIECESADEMNEWEKRGIILFNSKFPNGYNKTSGGKSNWQHTEESKNKISTALTGRTRAPEHCANLSAAHMGKRPSDATRKKMSESHTGKKRKPFTPEHRANLSAAHMGKHPSDATRKKMSASRSGEKNPNYGKHNRGRKLTDETKIKISASKLGENNPQYGKPARNRKSIFPNLLAEINALEVLYDEAAGWLSMSVESFSNRMRGRTPFTDEEKAILVARLNKPAEYLFFRVDQA